MVQFKNQPLVSVVIPTFNHADLLKRALDAVAIQQYSNLEVIIVDNHSEDHTDKVVDSFVNLNIKLLKIHNKGVIGKSRNYGIDESRGEWIAFLDSDDLWYPSRLGTCAQFLESKTRRFDVISTNELMVFSGSFKQRILKHGPSAKNMYREMLLYGNRLSPSATIVKKSFLDKYCLRFSESQQFVTAEDYDFWMQLARHKARFFFIDRVEGEYSIHANNASSQLDRHVAAIKCVISNHVFELQKFESNKKKLWRKIRSRIYLSDGIKRIRSIQWYKAIVLLILSFFSSPLGLVDIIIQRLKLKKKAKHNLYADLIKL